VSTDAQTDQQEATHGEDAHPAAERTLTVGLLAAPGLTHDLAEALADTLPDTLRERYPGYEWHVVTKEESLAGAAAGDVDLVDLARDRMFDEGWDLAICLTDLPLMIGRRPETAYVSVTAGVGVVSVPALGAVSLEQRVREAVLRLVDKLVGERQGAKKKTRRGGGIRARARHGLMAARDSPVGRPKEQEGTVRFVAAVLRGNLRLLVGMVRANRPWRLIAGLSRALAAALGTGAFGLASTGVWQIADGMSWARPIALSLGAVLATCVALIVAHRLWERVPSGVARERVVLFNVATTATVFLGVVSLYLALLVITTVCGLALIPSKVLESQIGHPVDFLDFLKLTVVVSMTATIGGALGSALESDRAVRQAAYGYRPDDD
jgi:hypothetical protein